MKLANDISLLLKSTEVKFELLNFTYSNNELYKSAPYIFTFLKSKSIKQFPISYSLSRIFNKDIEFDAALY